MTTDIRNIRAALLTRRARLEADVVELADDERALAEARDLEGGPGTDSADVASDLVEQEIAGALKHTASAELREVEHALERLSSGDYGRCEDCGEPIDHARLEARPWARWHASAERRWEQICDRRESDDPGDHQARFRLLVRRALPEA